MVSQTISIFLIVNTEILLSSRWSNVLPTLTDKTPVASRLSITSNTQHLADQQSQHKLQWSMTWKWTLRYFLQAKRPNKPTSPYEVMI